MDVDAYGVKLLYQYVVHSEVPQVLFEEQILEIFAESFEEAYRKAEKYAAMYTDRYINVNGDPVEGSLYKAVDCFLCYEEEDDVQEVYSGYLKLNGSALELMSTPCERDELSLLKHA